MTHAANDPRAATPHVTPTARDGADGLETEANPPAVPAEPTSGGNPKETAPSNAAKPREDWVTGDEPMTGAQASYLKTLCEEAGEVFDPDLGKADASKRIDALRAKSPRTGNRADRPTGPAA